MKEQAFPSAVRLIEDSLVLAKRAGAMAWLIYLAGIVPFFGLLLFESADMVQNPFAGERLLLIALIFAALYIWLHVCQSVFCARLHGIVTQQESPLKNQFSNALACQMALAGSKLLFWPVTLILIIPHPAVTMFYQHSLLGVEETGKVSWRRAIAEAKKDAVYRQAQSVCMLVLVFVLRAVLWINLLVLLFIVPELWKSFTGLEGNVTRAPQVLMNPTSLAALCILAYIGLDPLVKAACVLRRFARQSESSGRDLRVELSNLRRKGMATAVLVIVLCLPQALSAREAHAAVTAEQMNRAIQGVFHDPSDTWDLPVIEHPHRRQANGPFEAFLQSIADHIDQAWKAINSAVRNFKDWLRDIFAKHAKLERTKEHPASKTDVSLVVASFSALLGVAILVALWNRRRQKPAPILQAAVGTKSEIDLLKEDIAADEQTEDEWMKLAQQYRAGGNFRLALRALYLSSLAALARGGMISLARGKSNLDYSRELQRRAKRLGGEIVMLFRRNVDLFERSWYGNHPATEEVLDSFQRNFSALQKSF